MKSDYNFDTLTCVSAFYNIGRDAIDGRSLENYKEWLINTVSSIHCPFVFF